MFNTILQTTIQWSLNHGIKIIAIIIATLIILRILKAVIRRLIKSVITRTYGIRDGVAVKKRTATLESVFYSTVKMVIWVIAIMMIVPEFGINIGPILAVVGVAGLAFGFGAQYLIRDLIAGLFIILEDQYRKGDSIKVGDIAGTVEDINLRKTVIRDVDGVEHHIPNGEIKIASNRTKLWAKINLEIGVAYDTDIDKVIKVLNKIGEEMAKDKDWKDNIIEAPKALGVNEFGDSAIIIKVSGKVKPGEQWGIPRELRKRIKQAFDKEGIEIPFPHRVVIQKK
jgi:small conductance mechanosensitive channel